VLYIALHFVASHSSIAALISGVITICCRGGVI
jgi:hypothetical protein